MRHAHALFGIFLLGAFVPKFAHSKLLKIIHTNDLHGHFEHATDPNEGGYAAVKAVIDRLKADAQAQGMDVLVLDGGDVGEGSIYYFADKGFWTFQAMNMLGLDAGVFGNHDWLMGPEDLNTLFAIFEPNYKFLGANYVANRRWKHVRTDMQPYAEFQKADVKIAVLGLTTHSPMYDWRNTDGRIRKPWLVANEILPELKRRNDFIIGLTHLGVSADQKLVRKTKGFDLIVGGHSHTRLYEHKVELDRRGRAVPIVQTGAHGERVGELILDLNPGEPLEIKSYRLVEVDNRVENLDPSLIEYNRRARDAFEGLFEKKFLAQDVGYSNVVLDPNDEEYNVLGSLTAEAMREAVGAHVSINSHEFLGLALPPGPIDRESIIKMYPRIFELDRLTGWNIYTARVSGLMLYAAAKLMIQRFSGISFGGLTYDWVETRPGKYKIKRLRINGKRINPFKQYRVALPEGIVRGGLAITPAVRLLLKRIKNTQVPIWQAMESKIRNLGEIDLDNVPKAAVSIHMTLPEDWDEDEVLFEKPDLNAIFDEDE